MYIVSYAYEKEMCVRVAGKRTTCECSTYKALNICAHVMACIKLWGNSAINDFISAARCGSPSSHLVKYANAGKKLNESQSKKKGGRFSNPRSLQSDAVNSLRGYVVVRGSNRIKVCHACKTNVSGERFVLRHFCAVSYPKSIEGGGVEWVTLSKKSNHHFHLNKNS